MESPRHFCEMEGCTGEAPWGARYCAAHWREIPCMVRDCQHLTLPASHLCEEHGAEYFGDGFRPPLVSWLSSRGYQPPTLPGLGNAISTHGLPASQQALQTDIANALVQAGLPAAPATPIAIRAFRPPQPVVSTDGITVFTPNPRRYTAIIHNEGPSELSIWAGPESLILPAGQAWQISQSWLGVVRAFWCGEQGMARTFEVDVDRSVRFSVFSAA